MKIRLLFLIIFFTIKVYSQDYIAFPIENAIWGTAWRCQDIENEKVYRYTLSGEKLIEDIKYCELQVKLATFSQFNPSDVKIEELDPIHYREESKKVYFYNRSLKTDVLYYDFSLNIGDTFVFQEYDTLIVIEEIEKFERKGLVLQTVNNPYLGEFWTATWIQGMGSLNGLVRPIGDYGCGSTMDCFIQEDFSPLECSRNFHYLKIEENQISDFVISPNPTNKKLNIECKSNRIQKVQIISIGNGKEMFSKDKIDSNICKIDVSQLVCGVYVIMIHTTLGIKCKKLVVN